MHPPAAIYRCADLTIDVPGRRVRRGRRGVPLSALSFDALRVLVEAAPAAVSADELIDRAWRGAVVSDDAVTQRIRLLRRALGDDPRRPRYIETLRGAGYRLVPRPVAGERRAAVRLPPALLAGLAAAALALGAAWWAIRGEPPAAEAPALVPSGPVTAADLTARAVELFDQRNPVSLAHAIELYRQALAMAPDDQRIRAGLAVALAISVAWYNEPIAVARQAERLAREALAAGSSFEGEYALAVSLDAQGRIDPALAAYERAVALNPDHWGARASLAYLLQVKGRLIEALAHNVAAADRAGPGKLDVQIAACLRLLGFGAVASSWLERAERLDPGSAHAAPMRALDLITRGRHRQAATIIDQALARGIEQVELYEYAVVLALLNEAPERAATMIDSAPASISHRAPFETWRRIIAATRGGPEAAAAAVERSAHIRSAIAAGDSWPDSHLAVAMLEAVAGREAEALAALERLRAAGYRDYPWLEVLPPLAPLRNTPEYARVVGSMRADVKRQREQVSTAAWLPPELRSGAVTR